MYSADIFGLKRQRNLMKYINNFSNIFSFPIKILHIRNDLSSISRSHIIGHAFTMSMVFAEILLL